VSRSYYSKKLDEFLEDDSNMILGELTKNHQFSLEKDQRDAWIDQIDILKNQLQTLNSGHILFEYSIPRMGKRVDIIFLYSGLVFVIEFKVKSKVFLRADIDQCLDYAIDLKNFQEGSHELHLIPILVSTDAPNFKNKTEIYQDKIFKPMLCNKDNLTQLIEDISNQYSESEIVSIKWENSLYKPTPTIIEAAQALYQGHHVKDISRSDSGAMNLDKTAKAINKIIEKSKKGKLKSICFITGVPGSGKTLVGLNLANERHKFSEEEHAVFLSGNGPLVHVLQEALARDNFENSSQKIRIGDARNKSKAFIQNIHHFRDDSIDVQTPPNEKIVVFDEAQRAWDSHTQTSFMKNKKRISNFDMSEPEFLISIMDRHQDWAVIVCLVGGGQEINRGEGGLPEWFSAIRDHYSNWNVFVSDEITDSEYIRNQKLNEFFSGINYSIISDLHLKTSIRSFRTEHVSKFVKSLLDYDVDNAKKLLIELNGKYPIVITRNINVAKTWLKKQSRGNERYGIVASSKAHRLRPFGIYVNLLEEKMTREWFLKNKDDVRSSYNLEYVATEFHIQGLELDWTCVAWDGNFRFDNNAWSYYEFTGTTYNQILSESRRIYLKNAYRVLLTRARQGMVIFIPKGDDVDQSRKHEYYDGTFEYLKSIGIKEL